MSDHPNLKELETLIAAIFETKAHPSLRARAQLALRVAVGKLVLDRERLTRTRDELQSLLDVQPRPARTPYLKGLHGRDVVGRAVGLIDAVLEPVRTRSGRRDGSE